jgi:hypothetical protein
MLNFDVKAKKRSWERGEQKKKEKIFSIVIFHLRFFACRDFLVEQLKFLVTRLSLDCLWARTT